MKLHFLIISLLLLPSAYSQNKTDLINEIESFKKSNLQNSTYDVSFKELFDAMTIMGNQYFGTPVRESESRGYVEYFVENNDVKQTLIMEIKGDKQPYRISFNYKMEVREKLFKQEGTFGKPDYKIVTVSGDWKLARYDINLVNTNFNLRIYKILFGEFVLPSSIIDKVQNFNSKQKRDKHKIIA